MSHTDEYAAAVAAHEADASEEVPPTWHPVDLGPYLDGTWEPPEPTLLRRDDGRMALYPGSVSDIHGPSGSGKSWIALLAVLQALADSLAVVYIDFESDAGSITSRLLSMRADPKVLAERFHYIAPEESLIVRSTFDRDKRVAAPFRNAVLDSITTIGPVLVVVDGVTEAYAIHGLDPRHEADVAAWGTLVVRPMAALGPAVVQIDHVPKDGGHGAIGSQHKRAMLTGVSLSVTPKDAFGSGRKGRSYVSIAHGKDRAGQVIAHATLTGDSPRWANLVLESDADTGTVRATLFAPDVAGESAGTMRPTKVMERVSDALIDGPAVGMSFNALVSAVGKGEKAVKLAVELMEDEGYVIVEDGPRRSHLHRSLRPYRGAHDPKIRNLEVVNNEAA